MATSLVSTLHFDPYERLSPVNLRQEYNGKKVLITGGGYGIGASIAKAFAEANVAGIILVGRTESNLKSTTDDLAKNYPAIRVSYQVVDIVDRVSVRKLFDALPDSPDVLVNNAGFLSDPATIIDADVVDWWKNFEINVLGTILVTQTYLQHRAAHEIKTPAAIVAMNTFAAYGMRVPGLSGYVASKAALARVWEMISVDVPESVARFISVNPGAVRTAMLDKSKLEGSADFPTTDSQLAAEFIVWAASEEGAFLNGRLAWANWDLDELLAKKDEIVKNDLLFSMLNEV